MKQQFIYDDGGREAAGYKGKTGDCGTRAVAIATGLPYQEVYDMVIEFAKVERPRARKSGKRSHPRTGIFRGTLNRLLESLGWEWVPTMKVGEGCTVHLRRVEMPDGALIVRLSRH